MQKFARIVDHDHLLRDMHSKAILNTDLSMVRKHEKRVLDLQKEKHRDDEINSLKNDVLEIKELLKMLIRA